MTHSRPLFDSIQTSLHNDHQDCIVYIHGFLSSSQSLKAQQLQKYLKDNLPHWHLWAPDLVIEPQKAIVQLHTLITSVQPKFLVGSSLGGFYATYLAEHYQLPALLLNPAIEPWVHIPKLVGTHTIFSGKRAGQTVDITATSVDQLKDLHVEKITDVSRYVVLVTTGDDVTPYERNCAYFKGAQITILQDGDHAISDFPSHIPLLMQQMIHACKRTP